MLGHSGLLIFPVEVELIKHSDRPPATSPVQSSSGPHSSHLLESHSSSLPSQISLAINYPPDLTHLHLSASFLALKEVAVIVLNMDQLQLHYPHIFRSLGNFKLLKESKMQKDRQQ